VVQKAVQSGATCIGRPALLPEDVRSQAQTRAVADGAGCWIASETFLDERVRQAVEHVLPREDELTYRFGDTRVTLRPAGGDPNKLEVKSPPPEIKVFQACRSLYTSVFRVSAIMRNPSLGILAVD